ncbi:MAG: hypothetical protein Q8878_04430 [Bacillota bacterium]|nr:hypothetical protein [Bacillota bacterium]
MKRNKMTLPILSVALVLILGVFASFYWSFLVGSDNTSGIALPSGNTDSPSGNGEKEEASVQKIEITKENAASVIASMARPKSCSFNSKVSIFSDTGSLTFTNNHYIKNGYAKTVQNSESGAVSKNIITGGGMIFIWRPGSGDARYYSGRLGESTPDSEQMIPTYEDIVKLPSSAIIEANYAKYGDYNCIYVKAKNPVLKYIDEYWVSLDYGLLIHSVTTSGSRKIYEMDVDEIRTEEVGDSVFLLPNNKLAMDVTAS